VRVVVSARPRSAEANASPREAAKEIAMKRVLIASLGLLWLAAGSAQAADFFLKIDGIEGESIGSQGSENGGMVASWSFGASNPTSVGSSGMSQGRMAAPSAAEPAQGSSGTATVTKQYDKASPVLAKKCAQGEHIKSAQLTRCENGQCRTYDLQDVVISSYSLSNGGDRPMESLSLNFAKIEYKYAPADALRESPTRPSLKGGGASVGKPNPGK
jgi:type VI secretion system secreted protein Hcp